MTTRCLTLTLTLTLTPTLSLTSTLTPNLADDNEMPPWLRRAEEALSHRGDLAPEIDREVAPEIADADGADIAR